MNKRGLFKTKSDKPFKISRSKIELFLECRRCFYLDRVVGVLRPDGFPFNLNSAVDHLLKKEFDIHRHSETAHPLMQKYKIKARPFQHKDIDTWRENFVGVQFLHSDTNLLVFGAVDDVWINDHDELHVVDYKSTSKDSAVTINAPWQGGYRRQMEMYQWLLAQNGFTVSDIGYFVYANGLRDKKAFDAKLEFDVTIHEYRGDTTWVEPTLYEIKEILEGATCRCQPLVARTVPTAMHIRRPQITTYNYDILRKSLRVCKANSERGNAHLCGSGKSMRQQQSLASSWQHS